MLLAQWLALTLLTWPRPHKTSCQRRTKQQRRFCRQSCLLAPPCHQPWPALLKPKIFRLPLSDRTKATSWPHLSIQTCNPRAPRRIRTCHKSPHRSKTTCTSPDKKDRARIMSSHLFRHRRLKSSTKEVLAASQREELKEITIILACWISRKWKPLSTILQYRWKAGNNCIKTDMIDELMDKIIQRVIALKEDCRSSIRTSNRMASADSTMILAVISAL